MADNEQPERRDITPYTPPPVAPPPVAPPPVVVPPGTTPPVDQEQLRQFEQFQQFQQFQRYQEQYGGPPQLPPGKPRPWWKKVLFSKAFRKLLYLALVLGALIWAYNHFIDPLIGDGPKDDGLGTQGAAGPGTVEDEGRRAENPNAGIQAVYTFVSIGDARVCTSFFAPAGRAAFAKDFDAPDCAAAVAKLKGTVDSGFDRPLVQWSASDTVVVSSCEDLKLKPGTTALGKFTFERRDNGWTITGHEPEPDPCPAPVTTTSPRPTR